MRKLTIAVLLGGLALAAPAAAKEGQRIETVPGIDALRGGTTQSIAVTVVRVNDRAGAARERPVRGLRPLLTLENVATHRRVTAIGSPTDPGGHSLLRVRVPASGRWRAELVAGRQFWDGYPILDFGDAAPAAAQPGSSFPWIPLAAGGALVLILLGALRRFRLRPVALD